MSTTFSAPSLEFAHPLMNAAGSLGFTPDPYGVISFEKFGAFVTNPISTRARRVANPPQIIPFPGGVLIHTGYPNSGVRGTIQNYAVAWARAPLPIIVHLLSSKPDEIHKAILQFEDLENVVAVELGFEDDSSFDLVTRLIHAATGELPVTAQLPMQRALDLAEAALDAGASIVSLAPPRGALLAGNGKLVSGRLYGPAIFPQALEVVRQLTQAGYPVIGAGGVEENAQAAAMLNAGALAVQMDLALWKGIARNNIG